MQSCLSDGQGARFFQEAVRQRGLAVIDVSDDGKVSDVVHGRVTL